MPPGFYPGPDDPLVSANFSGWWNRSFRLISTTWKPLVLVQLLWTVPLLALTILSAVGPDETVTTVETDPQTFWHDFGTVLLIALPVVALVLLVGLITQLGMYQVMVQKATGQPVSIRAALLTGLRRTPAMIGWGILMGLLILVGALLCLLPGIYVAIALTVLPVVVLLERGQGIGRTFQLFHADFGASISRVATIIGLGIGFGLAENAFSAALGGGAFTETTPSVAVGVLTSILSVLFSIASNLVIAPLTLTAYADMRARREPFSTAYLAPATD